MKLYIGRFHWCTPAPSVTHIRPQMTRVTKKSWTTLSGEPKRNPLLDVAYKCRYGDVYIVVGTDATKLEGGIKQSVKSTLRTTFNFVYKRRSKRTPVSTVESIAQTYNHACSFECAEGNWKTAPVGVSKAGYKKKASSRVKEARI